MLLLVNAVALASTNSPIDQWPDVPSPKSALSVMTYDAWYGPYMNPAGQAWVNTINTWYTQGTAAGLTQDGYCSYDNNHASLRYPNQFYPQIRWLSAIDDYKYATTYVYDPRATFGNQSYQMLDYSYYDYGGGEAVIEDGHRLDCRLYYLSGGMYGYHEGWYGDFATNNFLLIAPACSTYGTNYDHFDFLSPNYLHTIGASGSDCDLMKPIVFAAASIPPAIKTRALRAGVYQPLLMYLFKSNITGNLKDPAAHMSAYTLPPEATDTSATTAPMLSALCNAAHNLQHVPPVARITVESAVFNVQTGVSYARTTYNRFGGNFFHAALRYGETLVLTINLTSSWTDAGQSLASYYAAKLRGWGTIEYLNPEKSRLRITIPWTQNQTYNDRTDIMLLVNDGMYDSAPAYVSVKHIQSSEKAFFGVTENTYPGNLPALDTDDQIVEANVANAVAVGSTVTGNTIDVPTDVDMFRFAATAGHKLSFSVTGALSPCIRIFDGSGNQLAIGTSSVQYTFQADGTYYVGVSGAGNTAYDAVCGDGDTNGATGAYSLTLTDISVAVAGCYVFYNNSKFDGNNPAANAADDAAIATDKTPLLPGHTATAANYTSYDRGINGVMVDLPGAVNVTASDFVFKVGNSNTPSNWTSVTNPTITVRAGAGVSGSTRVALVWVDGRISGKWLQVTVKATANTGIVSDTTFYFGNAVGESGNSASSARVDSADVTAARNDPHKTFANPAGVTDPCDFNRDGKVNVADEVISRQNATTVVTELKLITVP